MGWVDADRLLLAVVALVVLLSGGQAQ